MQKEAKKLNNLEKGKAADEKYLGEEQNVEARVRAIAQTNRWKEMAELTAEHSPWCECPICMKLRGY